MAAVPDGKRAVVLEVPTIRAGSRLHWVLLAVTFGNMLLISRDMPAPIRVGVVVLAGAAVLATVLATLHTSRRQPPVRVTPDFLELPDGDSTVRVDWPDITACRTSRRRLVVEVADPDRVRPAPDRWQRAAATHDGRYRLSVTLGGDRAIRSRLRAEMAGRIAR